MQLSLHRKLDKWERENKKMTKKITNKNFEVIEKISENYKFIQFIKKYIVLIVSLRMNLVRD